MTNPFRLHTNETAEPLQFDTGNLETKDLPKAKEDALRLAGQLWTGRTDRSPLTLLFSATTVGLSVSRVVYETGLALRHLNQAPVLMVDLHGGNGELTKIGANLLRLGNLFEYPPWTIEGLPSFALARLMESETDPVSAVCLERFSSFLELARQRFSCVLLDAGSSVKSVVGLLAATHCDGVVLSVRPGKSTCTEVQNSKTAFARVNGKVLGFVFDEVS
jgi:hypothetical protein